MLALLAVIAIASIAAGGGSELSLNIVRNLSFGSVERSSTTTIEYADMRAGQFIVQGRKNSHVRITVTSSELTNEELEIPLLLSNSQSAYSLDGGANWRLFSTGRIFQDLKFPNGQGNEPTSIHVRVGGTITVGESAPRGSYVGGVTLTASYLDDDNDDNDD
jgi:hypothetical protein